MYFKNTCRNDVNQTPFKTFLTIKKISSLHKMQEFIHEKPNIKLISNNQVTLLAL